MNVSEYWPVGGSPAAISWFARSVPGGAKIVGNLLYQALFDGYSQFKVRRVRERFSKIAEADEPKGAKK